MIHANTVPYTHVISKSEVMITQELKKTFQMSEPAGSSIMKLVRLRSLDEEPVIVETDYLPDQLRLIMEMDLENKSLYGLIYEKMGIKPANISDRFHIVRATAALAEYLNVPKNHPLLSVTQNVLDEQGNVIYYNEQIIKTESYEYAVESFSGSALYHNRVEFTLVLSQPLDLSASNAAFRRSISLFFSSRTALLSDNAASFSARAASFSDKIASLSDKAASNCLFCSSILSCISSIIYCTVFRSSSCNSLENILITFSVLRHSS